MVTTLHFNNTAKWLCVIIWNILWLSAFWKDLKLLDNFDILLKFNAFTHKVWMFCAFLSTEFTLLGNFGASVQEHLKWDYERTDYQIHGGGGCS